MVSSQAAIEGNAGISYGNAIGSLFTVLFGEDREMFSVGGANVMPAISADGHSLVFTGSFADATSVEYGICGYPKILFVDANGFPMPPFSLELTGGGSGGEPVETAATPTFSPAACSFYPATNVTLSCATSGATIRYTLDGSDPTSESAEYTAPIALSATTTVKARAFATGKNPSAVVSATYTLTDPVDPPDPPSGDHAFHVGETGYDTWADAMNAASAGGTVYLGADAEISGTQLKSLTIDLCGHTLTASTSDGPYIGGIAISVIDSSGNGFFTAPNGMNVQGTIDLSALTHDQFSIAGNRFWTGSGTIAKFPAGWTLDECKATFRNAVSGAKIVTQGVTYVYNGSSWVADAPGHDITITAPQNGTLETSVTNNVAAGTIVTVTATPAAGYELMSVTTNGAALAGATFEMPSEAVTLAATFEVLGSKMFYIGATGYDSWADVYNAAKDGDTIALGQNATMLAVTEGKTLTIDLAGHALEWQVGGWVYGTRTVIDTDGQGQLTLASGGRNVNGATVDLSSLTANQLAGTGTFWTRVDTVVIFPSDMALADCTPKLGNKAVGQVIVVQGVTYTWDGSSWVSASKRGMIIIAR